MYLLLKDHKSLTSDGLIPTRPVVSGNSSMGVHLTNILSEILEPLARRLGGGYELLSTEDLLAKIDQYNGSIEEIRRYYEGKLGYKIDKDKLGDLLVIVAADCVAMFPSMEGNNTGDIIGRMYLESDLEVKEVNWKELARYVGLLSTPSEAVQYRVRHLLPSRRYKHGPVPGLSSADVRSRNIDSDSQWVFPEITPSKYEVRCLIALALAIGIRTSFGLAVYTFGGEIFHQVKGGPIGSRLTMVAARLLMIWWDSKVADKLSQAELDNWLKGGYVDDLRFVLGLLNPGWRWSRTQGKFEWSREAAERDVKMETEPDETDLMETETIRGDTDEDQWMCPENLIRSLESLTIADADEVQEQEMMEVTESTRSMLEAS